MSETAFTVELRQQADYRFEVRFDNPTLPVIVTDEPSPLGGDAGPNPARLLGAAVANCLAASLLFALRKHKNDAEPLRAVATVSLARNAHKRLRIERVAVDVHLGAAAEQMQRLDRVLEQFEEFCIVTQSVRAAIEVSVAGLRQQRASAEACRQHVKSRRATVNGGRVALKSLFA